MAGIVEFVKCVIASAIRSHQSEMGLDNLDDRAAVELTVLLMSGSLKVLAADAARRQSKTSDGADANRLLVGDVQRRMEQEIVDLCGLEDFAAARLTSDVLRGALRYQPDLSSLRHELLRSECSHSRENRRV